MVLMDSNVTGMTRRCHLRCSRHSTMDGAFPPNRTMELKLLQGCQTATGHVEILQQASLMTQQDNAAVSSGPSSENIWGVMTREVYKNRHQFQTVDALRETVFTTAQPSHCPSRCTLWYIFQVIYRNGGAIFTL